MLEILRLRMHGIGVHQTGISGPFKRTASSVSIDDPERAASVFPFARRLPKWTILCLFDSNELTDTHRFHIAVEDIDKLDFLPNPITVDSLTSPKILLLGSRSISTRPGQTVIPRAAFVCDKYDASQSVEQWIIGRHSDLPAIHPNSVPPERQRDGLLARTMVVLEDHPAPRPATAAATWSGHCPSIRSGIYLPDLYPDGGAPTRDEILTARMARLGIAENPPKEWEGICDNDIPGVLKWIELRGAGWRTRDEICGALGILGGDALIGSLSKGRFQSPSRSRDYPDLYEEVTFQDILDGGLVPFVLKSACAGNYRFVVRCMTSDAARAQAVSDTLSS